MDAAPAGNVGTTRFLRGLTWVVPGSEVVAIVTILAVPRVIEAVQQTLGTERSASPPLVGGEGDLDATPYRVCRARRPRRGGEERRVYAVLAGGVGAARFLRGLSQVVPPSELVAIVNVGDDMTHLGLRICPDLDSITYWLGGVVHPDQQWGRADETHVVAGELARLGHDPWFRLGDRDLGVHLHRSARLRDGVPLSVVTDEVREAFDVEVRLLPATDDPVETRIHTRDGRDLHFQEYWVRERAAPPVASVVLAGADRATAGPGVVETILDADAVFVAPSNPVVSVGTILAVPGIAEAVRQTPAPVLGVSPIVGGTAVRGMADRLLPVVGAEVSAAGVARHYGSRGSGGILDGWIVDERDADVLPVLDGLGLLARATDTMMDDVEVAAALARTCLEVAAELGGDR